MVGSDHGGACIRQVLVRLRSLAVVLEPCSLWPTSVGPLPDLLLACVALAYAAELDLIGAHLRDDQRAGREHPHSDAQGACCRGRLASCGHLSADQVSAFAPCLQLSHEVFGAAQGVTAFAHSFASLRLRRHQLHAQRCVRDAVGALLHAERHQPHVR